MYWKKNIGTFAVIAVLVVLGAGLFGCERVTEMVPDAGHTEPSSDEIPIGLVVALTGQYAEDYGLPMQRGFELAREEINAQGDLHLTFVTADDQSTVAGAQSAVQSLVDQGVPAMVGIAISTQLKDAFPIAQENGVVAFSSVSSAAGLSSIGDFIFRTGLATDILIPGGVMATQEKLGYQRAAAIYDAIDVFSTSSHAEVIQTLEANGIELVSEESYHTGDADFTAQLTRIMEAAPDVLFISGLAQEMTDIIIQGRHLGIPASTHFVLADLSRDDVARAGATAEGAITFTSWSRLSNMPGNQEFVANYRATYGEEPKLWAAQSYATLYILAEAILNAGATDSVSIRDALAQTKDFPTVLGDFSFDPNGEAMYNTVVLIVKEGELVVFE